PYDVELHRVRVGDADGHVHQHATAALANLLEQRQARVPDRVRDRSTGRLGRILAVDVDSHPELQHGRLCAHDVASLRPSMRISGATRRYSVVPMRVASTNCSVASSMAR